MLYRYVLLVNPIDYLPYCICTIKTNIQNVQDIILYRNVNNFWDYNCYKAKIMLMLA